MNSSIPKNESLISLISIPSNPSIATTEMGPSNSTLQLLDLTNGNNCICCKKKHTPIKRIQSCPIFVGVHSR